MLSTSPPPFSARLSSSTTTADDNSFSQAPYVFDQGYQLIYVGAAHKLNDKTKVWAKYFWHNTAEDTQLGDNEIGHEFVVGASYTIMKGLTADINAGYLVAGDALDTRWLLRWQWRRRVPHRRPYPIQVLIVSQYLL